MYTEIQYIAAIFALEEMDHKRQRMDEIEPAPIVQVASSSTDVVSVQAEESQETWTITTGGQRLRVTYNTHPGSYYRNITNNESGQEVKLAIENDTVEELMKKIGLDFINEKTTFAKVSVLCDWVKQYQRKSEFDAHMQGNLFVAIFSSWTYKGPCGEYDVVEHTRILKQLMGGYQTLVQRNFATINEIRDTIILNCDIIEAVKEHLQSIDRRSRYNNYWTMGVHVIKFKWAKKSSEGMTSPEIAKACCAKMDELKDDIEVIHKKQIYDKRHGGLGLITDDAEKLDRIIEQVNVIASKDTGCYIHITLEIPTDHMHIVFQEGCCPVRNDLTAQQLADLHRKTKKMLRLLIEVLTPLLQRRNTTIETSSIYANVCDPPPGQNGCHPKYPGWCKSWPQRALEDGNDQAREDATKRIRQNLLGEYKNHDGAIFDGTLPSNYSKVFYIILGSENIQLINKQFKDELIENKYQDGPFAWAWMPHPSEWNVHKYQRGIAESFAKLNLHFDPSVFRKE